MNFFLLKFYGLKWIKNLTCASLNCPRETSQGQHKEYVKLDAVPHVAMSLKIIHNPKFGGVARAFYANIDSLIILVLQDGLNSKAQFTGR